MEETLKADLLSFPAEVVGIELRTKDDRRIGYIIKLVYDTEGDGEERLTLYVDERPPGLQVGDEIHICLEVRSEI